MQCSVVRTSPESATIKTHKQSNTSSHSRSQNHNHKQVKECMGKSWMRDNQNSCKTAKTHNFKNLEVLCTVASSIKQINQNRSRSRIEGGEAFSVNCGRRIDRETDRRTTYDSERHKLIGPMAG